MRKALVELQVGSSKLPTEVDTVSYVTGCGPQDYSKFFSHLDHEYLSLPLAVTSGERLKLLDVPQNSKPLLGLKNNLSLEWLKNFNVNVLKNNFKTS